MLTGAGYNPSGMSHMFERLMNASRLNEGTGWRAGRPRTPCPSTVCPTSKTACAICPKRASRGCSDDYWYVRAKLRVIQGQDTAGLRTSTQLFQDESRTLTGVQQSAAY